ncbi:MAG: hypothetical protein LUC34_01855 [Campylobacter sp.]|nr:hypothetical protein [Campylobacter sp.]
MEFNPKLGLEFSDKLNRNFKYGDFIEASELYDTSLRLTNDGKTLVMDSVANDKAIGSKPYELQKEYYTNMLEEVNEDNHDKDSAPIDETKKAEVVANLQGRIDLLTEQINESQALEAANAGKSEVEQKQAQNEFFVQKSAEISNTNKTTASAILTGLVQ